MKPLRKAVSKRLGSALVMTLVIVVLITVVTVGYLASVMLASKTAGAGLDQERAYGIAMIGVHEGMSRVRDALGSWDDPYKNFAVTNPPFYWSISPGRLTRFAYSSLSSTNYALFSESSTTNLVNLNRPLADGSYPIIGGGSPPDVSVKWANVLRDPSQTAGSNNAIIGRYAFWVDDEGAKININTADGTEKYTTNSLGVGSPSEVSLEVLFAGTNGKVPSKEIVRMARTNGFRSQQEILSATNVTSGVYTDNVFSLTAYSRSPELNVFGQPRLALSPLLGDAGRTSGNMVLNSLTLLPAREIYPTPSQLPDYVITSPYDEVPNTPRYQPWPLSLRGEMGAFSSGKVEDYKTIMNLTPHSGPNYSYNQGYLLAKYLAGTNAGDRRVDWPVFPGSSTQGFAGRYTPRQLDSIVAQILSIGSKAISSDYPYISGGSGRPDRIEDGRQIGHRFTVAPYVFPGWLSRQWVIGVGRSMKVTQMYVRIAAFPSDPPGATWDPANPSAYTPPFATMDFWLEWWLPAGYFGGNQVLAPVATRFFLGHRATRGVLNVVDMPRSLKEAAFNRFAAPLPRDPDADSSEICCYWANQLLRAGGIDLAGNPSVDGASGNPVIDRDQQLAAKYHDPFARINPASPGPWEYKGSTTTNSLDRDESRDYASPFMMTYLEPNDSAPDEWQPGEMRGLRSQLGPSYRLYMQTNATTLSVRGGIAVKTQFQDGYFSDPDPVPLEAVRGAYQGEGVCTQEPFTLEREWNEANEAAARAAWYSVFPGDTSNLRDRVLASVIPVNVDLGLGEERYVMAKVEDPLVNKFPGDWKATNSTTIQPPAETSPAVPSVYYEDTNIGGDTLRGRLTDPDSYWMPRADAGLCNSISEVASETLIPRSARMPNIGYLQYLRTGIIPDDEENVAYANQKGTPFRLLSFAPSYEVSTSDPLVGQTTTRPSSHPLGASQSYPDWALLDLLYIPSTLAPFGSTYNPAIANPSTNSAETKLLYYGTYGGATAGKINPNGAVIYTTNTEVAQTNVSRTLPLQAVLNGVKVNETLTGVGASASFTNGSTVPAADIARAIENFVRTNGPLRMPAEICNVSDIAALRAPKNPTRNDLVRQIVGTLTTQGNVFSVWTVGQAIQKKPGNTLYSEFEAGDSVLAEVRLRLIVERYLDPGADGVYGNSGDDGPDDVIGTYDDPMDANNHPFQPHYLYRVVASEEIR